MITISLCMIVKNEEHTIARCLDSVKNIADEIIIVDTGSTDRTKKIVRGYTDNIFDYEWIDDFAAARNYSFSLATMDYILWLDADDQLLEQDRQKLMEIKASLEPSVDSVSMLYHVALDLHGHPAASCRRNRLVKRINNYKWYGAVHEYLFLGPEATIFHSNISVTHNKLAQRTQRNLRIYEKLIAQGNKLSQRDLFHFADELLVNESYEKAIEQYLHLLDKQELALEDMVTVCIKISQCYLLLGNREKELHYLLKSFEYDVPLAEQCCRIGNHFFVKESWNTAVFWFNLAAQMEKPKNSWGLINLQFYTWLPHLQLAVCYGKIGMLEQAFYHNEIARSYLPDDPAVLSNKQILETHLGREGQVQQS